MSWVPRQLRSVKQHASGGDCRPSQVLNNERFTVPELLFHPSDVGFPSMGVAEAVAASLRSPGVDPAVRPLLLENVVLSGGCALRLSFFAITSGVC